MATNARAPLAKELRMRNRERRRIDVAQPAELAEVVTIPHAGYYRVFVSAVQRSNEPVIDKGARVRSATSRELWLLAGTGFGMYWRHER